MRALGLHVPERLNDPDDRAKARAIIKSVENGEFPFLPSKQTGGSLAPADDKAKREKNAEDNGSDSESSESSGDTNQRIALDKQTVTSKHRNSKSPTALRIRRVTTLTADGNPAVKDDDVYDEVELTNGLTLQMALEKVFKEQSNEDDLQNWTVRALVDGGMAEVPKDALAAKNPEIVIYRKGG